MRKITEAGEDELLRKVELRRQLSTKRLAVAFGISVHSVRRAVSRARGRRTGGRQ